MFITDQEVKKTLKRNKTRKKELMMGERDGVFCSRCHRRLSKPESMDRHAGPICHKHLLYEDYLRRQLKLFDI